MRIFLIGGSSQLGAALLPRLLAEGAQVQAISRNPLSASAALQWTRGRLPDHMPQVEVDALISFGPIDALAQWLRGLECAPASHLVATSSMSAVSKEHALEPADRAVAQRLREGEYRLADACERLGMRWTILRPTMIYGLGLDRNLTPIARRALRWHCLPFPPGRGLRQPVHAEDVAEAARRALNVADAHGRILELGGGERLVASEMFHRVQRSLGSTVLPIALPRWLLPLAATLRPGLRGALSRLDQDLIADNSEATRLLGVAPRPFQPTAATWQVP